MTDPHTSGAPWFVYMIECETGYLYTGITNALTQRLEKHRTGRGAAFMRMHKPLRLVASEPHPSRACASKAEALLKKFTRAEKLAWVEAHRYTEDDG